MRDITAANLREMLTETGLPDQIQRAKDKINAFRPPAPHLPNGVPQDWQEALFTPGVCAIPLYGNSGWRFCGICDGMPIDRGDGGMLMFDSYEEAMSQLTAWHEWKISQGRTINNTCATPSTPEKQ